MPSRVTRTAHKRGYRDIVYNINQDKFYTDAEGDQFEEISVTADSAGSGGSGGLTEAEVNALIDTADTISQSEMDAAKATKIWLMGDGTDDSYPNIRNQVNLNNVDSRLVLKSIVSNDIETVNINGLS